MPMGAGSYGGPYDLTTMARDGSFSCVVKTQKRSSKKIYKIELIKIRYKIK